VNFLLAIGGPHTSLTGRAQEPLTGGTQLPPDAARFAPVVTHLAEDGGIGPKTLKQLNKLDPARILKTLREFSEAHYRHIVAVNPAHPLARARKVGLEQVARERLITYTLADYPEYHAWLADLFSGLKQTPQIAEEHDSATSLIASVEAGRGVALVQQGFDCLTGPRLKVRPLTPAPQPLIVGVAYRKETSSPITKNFIAAAGA